MQTNHKIQIMTILLERQKRWGTEMKEKFQDIRHVLETTIGALEELMNPADMLDEGITPEQMEEAEYIKENMEGMLGYVDRLDECMD